MPFSVQTAPTAPGEAGSTRWLGEAAASLLADSLTASGIGAWPREDRVEVFDRLQVPMTSELTRATMIRIGELIGASEVVFGEVRVGESLTVRAHTIRLDTGRRLPDVTETAPVSEMFALFGRVATQIGKHTGRATTATLAPPPPMPLAAFENYIKGLMAATPAAQQKFLESAMSVVPHDGRVLMALWNVYFEQGLHDKALVGGERRAGSLAADPPRAVQRGADPDRIEAARRRLQRAGDVVRATAIGGRVERARHRAASPEPRGGRDGQPRVLFRTGGQ